METNTKEYVIKSHVDRQATSLLDITFWSNIVVIVVVIVINIVNIYREGIGGERLIAIASPMFVVIVSVALCVWMAVSAVSAAVTKKRLKRVYVAVTQSGIEGVSMPEPMTNKKPKRFSVEFGDLREARTVEVSITKKNVVPSLKIGNAVTSYTVPAPERLREILTLLLEHMPKD